MIDIPLFNITASTGVVEGIDNRKLENEILSNSKRRSDDPITSLFEDTILNTPYNSESKKLIDYMRTLGKYKNLGLNAFWSQIHHPLESTDTHYHGDDQNKVMLSWVYYVKVPNDSGNLVFLLDDKDNRCPLYVHAPTENSYIIFPSYLLKPDKFRQ